MLAVIVFSIDGCIIEKGWQEICHKMIRNRRNNFSNLDIDIDINDSKSCSSVIYFELDMYEHKL